MAACNPLESLKSLMDSSAKDDESGAAEENEEDLAVASIDEPIISEDAVVVCCGATAWDLTGDVKESTNIKQTALFGPSRLVGTSLDGIKVQRIISGPCASHTFALTDEGVFAWGKNNKGQLGVGDEQSRNAPTLVTGLTGSQVTHAAVGRYHSVFVTSDGNVFACGWNKFGAVGPTPKKKQEIAPSPVIVPGMGRALRAAAGNDFSMIVDSEGSIWAWGWSEYGQLGLGTDGSYNKSDSSVKMTFEIEKQPQKIQSIDKVVQLACGPHHCVALSSEGVAYTWGCGGYGRLGHQDQQDIWTPKPIPNFLFRSISCGNAWCCGIGWRCYNNSAAKPTGAGMLHMWGRVNPTKDSWMYPKPEYELQGWNVDMIACGNNHTSILADGCVIVWGSGCQFGELGFGENGPKSSARPKKMDLLEGVNISQVACGMFHTVYLASGDVVSTLPTYTPEPDTVVEAAPKKGKGKAKAAGNKRGAGSGGAKGPKAKKKK